MRTPASSSDQAAGAINRRQFLSATAGLGALAVLSPALLAACGGSSPGGSGESSAGGQSSAGKKSLSKLRWAMAGLPTLNLANFFGTDTSSAQRLVCESLLAFGAGYKLENQLAESVTRVSATEYKVQVRSGVQFSDGSPLTAKDVAASWQYHMDPKNASQLNSYMAPIDSVTAVGDSEVDFTLKTPTAFLQYFMAIVSIMPAGFISKNGKKIGAPGAVPVGTGPYVVASFTPDQSATFTRNPKFHGTPPAADTVELTVISDGNSRLLAAQGGQMDGTFDAGTANAGQWDSLSGFTTQWVPSLGSTFIGFGLANPLWQDIHVRRAVAHCLDRAGLVKALLQGKGQPADCLVPPEQWGSLLSVSDVTSFYSTIPIPAFDIDMAKHELAQSAHPDGFSFSMIYPDTIPEDGKVLQSLAQNLKSLNVSMSVKEVPANTYYTESAANKGTSPVIQDFAPDYPDPADYPMQCFAPAAAVANAYNTAHWKDAQVGSLLQQYGSAGDDQTRVDIMKQVLTAASDQLPYLPIWWRQAPLAIRSDLHYSNFNGLYYYDNFAAAVQ